MPNFHGFAIRISLAAFLALAPLADAWAAARRPPLPSEKLTVKVNGRSRADIEAFQVDDAPALSMRDVQILFGGRQSWERISRRVSYLANGQKAEFTLDTASVTVNGRVQPLTSAVRHWSGQAYIPLSFVVSKTFQDITENDVYWDPDRRALSIAARPGVSSPELASAPESTSVSLDLKHRVTHRVMENRKGRVLVRFFGGRSNGAERLAVRDGLVESVRLMSKAQSCDLEIITTPEAAAPKITFQEIPRRLTIQIASKSGRPVNPEPEEEPVEPDLVAETTPEPVVDVSPVAVNVPVPAAPVPSIKPAPKPKQEAHSPPIQTIVIDAGHGGKDSGAKGPYGTMEKDINLEIALALAKSLRREGRFKVILTRDTDEFIPLADRTKIANKQKADLFISIHCNAAERRDSNGFEVYFLSENATDASAAEVARRENAVIELEGMSHKAKNKVQDLLWSMARTETMNESSEVAGLFSAEVKPRLGIPHRGVKQAGFYVLRGANMPAVLVETAFISHPREERLLRTGRFQQKIVDGIHAGVLDYEKRKIQSRTAKAGSRQGG